MKKHAVVVFVLLIALIAAVPIFAGNDINCSDQATDTIPEGQVPPGNIITGVPTVKGSYHNIIVDSDCYISPDADVKGNIIEPDDTEWSIFVDAQATVRGTIKERGSGDVRITVGHDEVFKGTINEAGPGNVHIWVDGIFLGNTKEKDDGWLKIVIFGDAPAGGPGTFTGSAVEDDSGDADLFIEAPGVYKGNFKEKGDGVCTIYQPPTSKIKCN